MLIHGAWLSSRSWENFADYFRKRGFAVSAPEWPRKDGGRRGVASGGRRAQGPRHRGDRRPLRRSRSARSTQPPVLIGHSFGGLIVELLLDRGLGRAGVALSPAPPKGILVLPFSSLKAAAPALAHPSKWHGIVPLTLEEFTYGFVNTFSPEDAAAAYERYAVPETGQIFYEAGFANFHFNPPTEVHFKNAERAPLLIVGAEKDNTVPASLVQEAVREVRALAGADGLPRVRGPAAPAHGGGGLGGGRRGDRQLARRSARGADAARTGRDGVAHRADGRNPHRSVHRAGGVATLVTLLASPRTANGPRARPRSSLNA